MNIEDKINTSLNEIDYVLNQKVKVYFVNIVENAVLVNSEGLPNIFVMKKELNENIIKEKLEYLMSTKVVNLKNVYAVDGQDRYYCFDFEDSNILSSYYYIPIFEITNTDFLKLLKDIID